MNDRVRMFFDVSEERADHLREIMDACSIQTEQELCDNALALFMWAVKQKRIGRHVASMDGSKKRIKEMTLPAFDNVKPLQ